MKRKVRLETEIFLEIINKYEMEDHSYSRVMLLTYLSIISKIGSFKINDGEKINKENLFFLISWSISYTFQKTDYCPFYKEKTFDDITLMEWHHVPVINTTEMCGSSSLQIWRGEIIENYIK